MAIPTGTNSRISPHSDEEIPINGLKREARWVTGAYYTPPSLVEIILDNVLDPALPNSVAELEGFSICDPACGTGHFLLPAAQRLAARWASLTRIEPAVAAKLAVEKCIFGVDSDERAVAQCRRNLQDLAPRSQLEQNLRCADSLSGAPPEYALTLTEADRWCVRHGAPRGPLHWSLEYPKGFDVVLGNPPFLNVIERRHRDGYAAFRRAAFPELDGTADRAFHFLALAARILKPGGVIGMVLPRAFLNAPSASRLRQRLNLRFSFTPTEANLFDGAAVFVTLVGIGPPGPCRVLGSGTVPLESSNWWLALSGAGKEDPSSSRLRDHFEVSAGMTAADAYDSLEWLQDDPVGAGQKLLTTGLIDPGEHRWGSRTCRYLGRKVAHPRLNLEASTASLKRRLAKATRPKIIVAGLSKRVEPYLDLQGEFMGAVSTYVIHHAADDVAQLSALQNHLLTAGVSRRFTDVLGANAMGGGSITMKKSFLENLPWAPTPS